MVNALAAFSIFVARVSKSEIFEEKYVDPMSVNLEFPKEKRNLIYIFLESMETTYFSKEEGGALEYNIIPELYDLAEENISFSNISLDISLFKLFKI